jgi:hypothetical protein
MTMAASRPRAETGLLLLADISGYTAFLDMVATAHPDMTEVAPAYPVLSGMLPTVVDSIAPTFILAEIEGDAVFAFAPAKRLARAGEELLGLVRGAHAAFRARIEEAMVVHYHPCTACTVLPTLDLKFVLHHGNFVVPVDRWAGEAARARRQRRPSAAQELRHPTNRQACLPLRHRCRRGPPEVGPT